MKQPVHSTSSVRWTTETRYEFTAQEIVHALRVAGYIPMQQVVVPLAAQPLTPRLSVVDGHTEDVYMRVPGGGDWSNTNLSVAPDCPLVVQIKLETATS